MSRTADSGLLRAARLFGAALPLLLGLAACGSDYGTREFGIQRSGEGQTRVTGLPPLSVPPILTQPTTATADLPPAESRRISAARAGRRPAPSQARGPSSGEAALIGDAGPSAAPDIREKVDEDAQIGRANPSLSDKVMNSGAGGGQMIQRGSTSWWDRLF